MSLFFANIFNKVYGYVILMGLMLSAVLATYLKGRGDANRANRQRTLEQDVFTRGEADRIRRDVDAAPSVDERVRRWTRPGS